MFEPSTYGFFADVTAFVHLLYVIFVVAGQGLILMGGIFAWRFVKNMTFRIIHLIAIAIVAVQEMLGVLCPLTVLEYYFRNLAGQSVNTDLTFVMRIFRSMVFISMPDWMYTVIYIGTAVIVLATMFVIPPMFKQGEEQPSFSTPSEAG